MLRAQRVRRSTHGDTSACLSAPPSTSRCLPSDSSGSCGEEIDSGQISPESEDRQQVPFGHGALIRNEGPSVQIRSPPPSERPETPEFATFSASVVSCSGKKYTEVHTDWAAAVASGVREREERRYVPVLV